MAEVVLYKDQWATRPTTHTALGAALLKLGHKVFTESTATAIHHGLNPDIGEDQYVTGLSGIYSPGTKAKNSWTIRWDWDAQKGVHVNLVMKTARGTEKYAFLEMRRDELERRNPDQVAGHDNQQLYWLTIQRLTSDCEWNKKHYDSLPAADRKSYKEKCASSGHRIWTDRAIGGHWYTPD